MWPVHNNQVAAPGNWNMEHLEPGRCSGGSMMSSWGSDHSSMFMLITPLNNDNRKGVPMHMTRKLLFNPSCNCPWVMSASRWDINQESSMEKLSVSYNLRVLRGVSVNWDNGCKSRLPHNFPNLAGMTNTPTTRRWEVWKFDPFYTLVHITFYP